MTNVTLAVYALYDAGLPFGLMPILFSGPSSTLDAILARTDDHEVINHFRKIAAFRNSEREKYTESTINRLHQFFSSLLLRTLLSGHGEVTVTQLLRDNRAVIMDVGPAEGTTPEHARMIQSIFLHSYYRATTRVSGSSQGAHFLPEYEEVVEHDPVYLSTSDQFLEAALSGCLGFVFVRFQLRPCAARSCEVEDGHRP